jgi:hypothetical protein
MLEISEAFSTSIIPFFFHDFFLKQEVAIKEFNSFLKEADAIRGLLSNDFQITI